MSSFLKAHPEGHQERLLHGLAPLSSLPATILFFQ